MKKHLLTLLLLTCLTLPTNAHALRKDLSPDQIGNGLFCMLGCSVNYAQCYLGVLKGVGANILEGRVFNTYSSFRSGYQMCQMSSSPCLQQCAR
jgi:hypothetical protein